MINMGFHPRYNTIARARADLKREFTKIICENDLSYGEITMILTEELSDWARYQIRTERHPNDLEKKSDEKRKSS